MGYMTVVLENDQISYYEKENTALQQTFGVIWPLQEFESQLELSSPSDLIYLCYHPRDGLFTKTVLQPEGKPNINQRFDSPEEDPVLKWVDKNIQSIRRAAEYRHLKNNSKYPNEEYKWNETEDRWDAQPDPDKDQIDAVRLLSQCGPAVAVGVSYIWEALVDQGIIDPSSVPAEIVTAFDNIIANRSKTLN